uniref:PPUP7735 n=1 Tax=Poeciliopsis prolifica TaxID=188132 RepID=A0A0S7EVX8_9TELE
MPKLKILLDMFCGRSEGLAGGPVDRDGRHNDGRHPAGGEPGSHGRRSAGVGTSLTNQSLTADFGLVSPSAVQVWQPWPSRTRREGSGSRKTTSSPTASQKGCRAKWTGNTWTLSRASPNRGDHQRKRLRRFLREML